MIKSIALGIVAMIAAFVISTSVAHGQTATATPTPTMTTSPTVTSSPTNTNNGTSTTVPNGAPNTGYGN